MWVTWPHRTGFLPHQRRAGTFRVGPISPVSTNSPKNQCLPAPASGPVVAGIALRTAAAEHWLLTVSPSFLSLRYSPKSPALQSETVHYKRGVSQQFSLPSFKIDFSEWKDDEVTSWPLA